MLINGLIICFGISTIKEGLYINTITQERIHELRDQLEEQVGNDAIGTTDVLLGKMLLTQAVTTLSENTLCVAEIDEKDLDGFNRSNWKMSSDVWR